MKFDIQAVETVLGKLQIHRHVKLSKCETANANGKRGEKKIAFSTSDCRNFRQTLNKGDAVIFGI